MSSARSMWLTTLAVFVVLVGLVVVTSGWKRRGSSPQFTASEKAWIRDHRDTVTVASDPGYPPIDFLDDEGRPVGISEDVLKHVEQRSGLRFKRIRFESWTDTLKAVENRQLDVIRAASINPERSKYLYFTQPFIVMPTLFIANTPSQNVEAIDRMPSKRVAISDSYAAFTHLQKHYPNATVIPVRDDAEGLIRVSMGTVDFAVSDLPTASYMIRRHRLSNLHIAGETGFIYKMSIASRSDWPILNSILTKSVESISTDEREDIIAGWINLDDQGRLYSHRVWFGLSVFATSIAALWIAIRGWNYSLLALVRKRTQELRSHEEHLERAVQERTRELVETNERLSAALLNIRTLTGILPICANCKKIRNDAGYWEQVELYIKKHTDADFSHGICPECAKKLYPEIADKISMDS